MRNNMTTVQTVLLAGILAVCSFSSYEDHQYLRSLEPKEDQHDPFKASYLYPYKDQSKSPSYYDDRDEDMQVILPEEVLEVSHDSTSPTHMVAYFDQGGNLELGFYHPEYKTKSSDIRSPQQDRKHITPSGADDRTGLNHSDLPIRKHISNH